MLGGSVGVVWCVNRLGNFSFSGGGLLPLLFIFLFRASGKPFRLSDATSRD